MPMFAFNPHYNVQHIWVLNWMSSYVNLKPNYCYGFKTKWQHVWVLSVFVISLVTIISPNPNLASDIASSGRNGGKKAKILCKIKHLYQVEFLFGGRKNCRFSVIIFNFLAYWNTWIYIYIYIIYYNWYISDVHYTLW